MDYKVVRLSEIFNFPAIKGVTEKFILDNPGNIPVYGGKKTETPIGYIKDNLPGVKYFENCLAWNREGSVGYVFWHKHKFTTNDHHRPMILKEKYKDVINLEYVRIVLEKKLLRLGLSWSKTAAKEKVKEIEIEIPIKENGEFDIEKQNEIAQKYKKIQMFKKELQQYTEKLEILSVTVSGKYSYRSISLGDTTYFKLSIGKRIVKKDIFRDNLEGDKIPIYSANVYKPFGYINQKKAEKKYCVKSGPVLIWGIDGKFDWNYIPDGQMFCPTDHCGVLEIKNEDIYPQYFLYVLRNEKNKYGFDRTFRASLRNVKENIVINIPIKENGDFDLELQQQIAKRYTELEKMRHEIIKKLRKIQHLELEVEIE